MCPCGADGRRPRSIRMDESPAVHGGRADRWSAALQSDAMHIGRIRRAMRGSRPTVGSTRMGPCGVDGRRPRSTRMDESPAVHGGRADRWSAALRSDATYIGTIRHAMRGSRPTVGSTWGETTGSAGFTAADQRSALPRCVHGARMDTPHDPFGWTNHPRSMGVELTVGQLLSYRTPRLSEGSAAPCTAADQRSALPGVRPWGSAGCIATDQRSALPGWEVFGGPAAPRVGVLTNRLRQAGTDRVGEDVGGLAAQVVVLA